MKGPLTVLWERASKIRFVNCQGYWYKECVSCPDWTFQGLLLTLTFDKLNHHSA